MFKLESYITPLLLSYVDKYIKNLKPEDSQFSLWGGDAVFSNLDLRLDVLEQELQLPFTFINGHIHELRIHIPWTKLGSEPVIITINTIECILKLCTDKASSDSSQLKKTSYKKHEITEAPPGYVQSLINRVVSNICIICNNLILKYVEDDIVLSLNIKSVELFNANEKWEKAFVDTNIADTVSRKVIYMQDLTVCLDKRDGSGKIETYQDPLLYRCSSTWRMYSVYNFPHSKYPSLTRIHMYCENLDFSLTDQQLPMFLRLLYLCLALHNKTNLTDEENVSKNEDQADAKPRISDEESGIIDYKSQEETWGSWAWSYLPDVSPLWSYPGSEEEHEKESNLLKSKKIFQFGVYIGKSSCILKNTVLPQDSSYCSPSKCTFSPLMIIKMYGCCMELTLKGKDFINVQSGICGITVTGLENCVCGYQDLSGDELKNVFLKSGVPPGSGHSYSFLSSSLFDPLAPENCNQERKYCFNSAEHISTFTEEVMVQRFPAFAFDYIYELEVPEEWIDRISSITSTFLEGSNWHETAMHRAVFGPLCLDITSSLIHRLKKLMVSAQDYDYPYYAQSRKPTVHQVEINDDMIEEMEEFVPVRQYHATFFKPVFRVSFADHSPSLIPKTDSKRVKKRHLKSSKYMKSKLLEPHFNFEIYADCLDLHSSTPLYANKLLKVVESLPNPSQFIISRCYDSKSIKIFGLEITLHYEDTNMFPGGSCIMQQTCLAFFSKTLILPENWTSMTDLTLKESSLEISSFQLKISEISLLAMIGIYQSWVAKHFNWNGLENLKTAFSECKTGSPVIFAAVKDVTSLYTMSENLTSCKFSISEICIKFLCNDQSSTLFNAPESTSLTYTGIIPETCDCNYNSVDELFLQLLLQIPKLEKNKEPALLILRVSGSTACVEPAMFEWMASALFPHLSLQKSHLDLPSCGSLDLEDNSTCSSVTQEASASQSLSKSYSSTAVKEKKSLPQAVEDFLLEYAQALTLLIIEVEIGSLCGIMPQKNWSINHKEGVSTLKSWQEADSNGNLKGACAICLPTIKMQNNNFVSDFIQVLNVKKVSLPYKILLTEKKGDYFPWNLQITSFSIYTVGTNLNPNYSYLLFPSTVSATIGLSSKGIQNQLALCIHMDSKCVNFNLSAFQADLFVNCYETMSVSSKFMERLYSWISYFYLESYDTPEYDISTSEVFADEYIDAKKGYEANSQSKKTSLSDGKSVTTEERKKSNGLTLWTQLTLSKLCIVLNGKLPGTTNYENFKVQLDGEEIVCSLDIQDVYTKVKTKLSSLNVTCFIKKGPDCMWQPGPYEGRVLFCNNVMSNNVKPKPSTQHSQSKPDNQPFMVATFTRALHSNVKEKLSFNAKQDVKFQTDDLKYISEIDLKVKSFGMILWMSFCDVFKQLFYPFLKTSLLTSEKNIHANENSSLIGVGFCTQNLPLFYIETNAIQIYIPDNIILNCETEVCDSKQNKDDVLLLQLDSITLTSQVENPLPRIVLDTNIYSTAVNSKTIGVPGSAVEDRQYQLDIYSFMLGTIHGSNISHRSDLKRDIIPHYPLTMGENPALEWNIGVIPENRTFSNNLVTVTPILSPFNIRIAVAPAIVINPNKELDSKKIIISGISSEVSITNEVCVYLGIHQMCTVYALLKSNMNFLLNTFNESLNSNIVKDSTSQQPYFYSAFGFDSEPSLQTDDEKKFLHNLVPFELLVTAENVAVMFFHHGSGHSSKDSREDDFEYLKTLSSQSSEVPSEASDHEVKYFKTVDVRSRIDDEEKYTSKKIPLINLHPFLCLSIVQPHSYVLCHPSSQKFESSCFDLLLNGSPVEYIVEKPHEVSTPISEDFSLHFLETKSGELNEKTGIPPAFFTITCTDVFSKPANVKISIERPMKINFRSELCDSSLAFLQCFKQEFSQFSAKHDTERTAETKSLMFQNKILPCFKNIALETTQVVLEVSPTSTSGKLVFSASNLAVDVEVEGSEDNVKCVNLKMDTSSFAFLTSVSDQVWNFMQPLTFSTLIKCHLNPCLQFESNFSAESLILNLSLHHVMKLKQLIEDLRNLVEKNLLGLGILNTENVENYSNAMVKDVDTPKRIHWSDDLRKGTFQFVQISESSETHPKTNEIMFCGASANQPAYMSWCYPEPRALTKIEVSPVPFQCGEESDKKAISCYLQYWNSSLQEYVNSLEFVLSETEHCSLKLPDLNSDSLAVSDKWRVLLDSGSYIDDEGVLEKENPYLSPLALAACMSIDSCFDPNLVPSLQIRSSFELIKIVLYCSFKKTGHSPKLHPFEYDEESPWIQEFSILSFINPSLFYVKKTSKINAELSSGLKCEVLEHRNLTMIPLLSPVDIFSNATLSYGKSVPVFDFDFVLNPCFVRLSQSIIHTLTYTVHSVSQELEEPPSKCIEYMLPNQYMICNNLEERIRFGQAGTEENIILSPLKMHAYSWWCHKGKQLLWLSVGSLCWKWSREFSIDNEGIHSVLIDKSIAVIIKVKKLSNLQKQVIVDGQFVIHSQLNFPIQMRCEFPVNVSCKAQQSSPLFVKYIASEHSSPSFLLSEDHLKTMHLSITGILDSQLWSENISFGDTKVLQIPWKTNGMFQSVWCQVVSQKITDSALSVMVFLSPLFILRNNFPITFQVDMSYQNKGVLESVELGGKGKEIKLPKSSASDLSLNIHSTDLEVMIPQIVISESDLHNTSCVDHQNSNVCEKFLKKESLEYIWPYSFLEKSLIDPLYPCSESNTVILPAVQLSEFKIQARVEKSFCWNGLNTILYDVKPHVMVVNRLRHDLYLFKDSELQWKLPTNSVALPIKPFENFYLSILENGKYFNSCLLSVQKFKEEKPQNAENPDPAHFYLESSQCIPCGGSINVIIKVELEIFKVFLFKLTSEVHQDIIVITAFPLVILSSNIDQELQFSLFCFPSMDENVVIPIEKDPFTPNNSVECNPFLFWQADRTKFSSNAVDLGFHISVSSSNQELWSYPVHLDPKLSDSKRHTLYVPINSNLKSTTLPLVITSHWASGMLFLILNIDPCPLLLLHNRTAMNIFYGQNYSGPDGKCVFEESIKFFEVPSLCPDSSAHYSFPILQKSFPQVPEKIPMLCLGLKEDSVFVWSPPFKINVDKQFVHILGICDFMVHSERVGHTIKLYIDPVNRIEVNANEVRSRIALATHVKQSEKTETSKSTNKKVEMKIKRKSLSRTSKGSDSQALKNFTSHFVNFRLIHISFIICDELQQENEMVEVLRLNLTNVILSARPRKENCYTQLQDISLCFEQVQLDNQIEEKKDSVWCDFPVVFHRSVSPKTSQENEDYDNFLPNKIRENAMLVLNLVIGLPNELHNAFVVQSFNVNVLPASLHFEDTFYYQLISLLNSYTPISFHRHESPWSDLYLPKEVKYSSLTLLNPLHFQSCNINIPEISLSLHASLKLYLSLERSLLRFQPFVKEELFTSPYELGRLLVLHYLTGALFRAGWVVGSLDLLGNPAGFARAVGAGMSDFVYLPYQGLLQGPRAFVSGLTTGAMSLLTQVSSGAINCMASLASSISKNMDFLCLDDEHLARQELIRRHLPQGVSDGLLQGLSVFGLSILGAVAGIVDHPMQVLMHPSTPMRTASGVVGGLGKGIIGVFTKPIGGAAELLSQAGYGLLHGAGWLSLPKRQYQPMVMSLEMCSSSMLKYVCKVALCQSLGDVLLSVEATYVNQNSEYESNVLLLTSEALCILSNDEVTLQRTFALTEIRCKSAENDRSTMIIMPSRAPHKPLHLETNDALERVSEYLKINKSSVNSSAENSSQHDVMPDSLIKSNSSNYIFFLYPKDRSLFLTLFNHAKSKALRKGF